MTPRGLYRTVAGFPDRMHQSCGARPNYTPNEHSQRCEQARVSAHSLGKICTCRLVSVPCLHCSILWCKHQQFSLPAGSHFSSPYLKLGVFKMEVLIKKRCT